MQLETMILNSNFCAITDATGYLVGLCEWWEEKCCWYFTPTPVLGEGDATGATPKEAAEVWLLRQAKRRIVKIELEIGPGGFVSYLGPERVDEDEEEEEDEN